MKSVFTILIAIIVLFTACTGSSQKKESADKNAAQAVLKDVDAKEFREVISSYKGEKALLVNVWATWCVPCVEEFPGIVKIQRNHPDKLQVIFISADFPEDRDRALKFLKEHHVEWTTYFKDDKDEPFINAVNKDWSGALPFSMVIDKRGNEVTHWENKASFDTFNTYVNQAINR